MKLDDLLGETEEQRNQAATRIVWPCWTEPVRGLDDWRYYVPERLRGIWATLPIVAAKAAYVVASDAARRFEEAIRSDDEARNNVDQSADR